MLGVLLSSLNIMLLIRLSSLYFVFLLSGSLLNTSSDPLSFICPEELQGSDGGILVQIQLDSEVERKKARDRRPEEPPSETGGSSSCKKPRVSNFRRQREIIQKGESIKVSRLWKETYDFSLDSKFRKNPRDETVLRALHG